MGDTIVNRFKLAVRLAVFVSLALVIALSAPSVAAAEDFLWVRQFGTGAWDQAYAVAASGSNAYVVGRTNGAFPGFDNQGSTDAFIRKYGNDGNHAWTRQFGTSGHDVAFGVAADSSGVYVVGRTGGTFSGETSQGGDDAFVRKYNADGFIQWTRQFGSSLIDDARGVFVDSSGVYVVGRAKAGLKNPDQTSLGGDDAFIRKYNTDGTHAWTRQFGTSADDEAHGVTAGIYVVGRTEGTFSGQTSAGGTDAFTRKYDSSGNVVVTRQFGSSAFDEANGAVPGMYVAGTTSGTLPGQSSHGNDDGFIALWGESSPPPGGCETICPTGEDS